MFELIPFDRRGRRMSEYDPFREMEELERSFWGNGAAAAGMFHTDVIDTGDAFRVECELPGFRKEDISIDIENDCLTISAERKVEQKEDSKETYIKRERVYGKFSRSFDVSGVTVENIEAAYNNGILEITMPKKVETIPASRKLEIK